MPEKKFGSVPIEPEDKVLLFEFKEKGESYSRAIRRAVEEATLARKHGLVTTTSERGTA